MGKRLFQEIEAAFLFKPLLIVFSFVFSIPIEIA
jgi:hypothetical protein